MSNLLSAIELEEENANLRQEIEYLKRALNNKEDELYQLEEEMAVLSSKYKNLLIDHEKRMYELEAESDEKLSRLRDELNQQKQDYRDLENSIEDNQAESENYKVRYEILSKNVDLIKQQRDSNRADYVEATKERDMTQHELEEAKDNIEQLEASYEEKQQEMVELAGQAVRLQNSLNRQLYEKSVLYTKAQNYDTMKRKLNILSKFYENVKNLYAATSDRNIDLSTELEELKKQLYDKMVDESEKSADYVHMKNKMDNFDEEMELKMDIIGSLEDDLSEARKLQSRYKEEIGKLEDVAAQAIHKQEQLQYKFEAEVISQEVLKIAIEKEFAIIGEVIGSFAQQNLEAMKKWDAYIDRKDSNIKQLKALTQQMERIQEDSKSSEREIIQNLKDYFDVEVDEDALEGDLEDLEE